MKNYWIFIKGVYQIKNIAFSTNEDILDENFGFFLVQGHNG